VVSQQKLDKKSQKIIFHACTMHIEEPYKKVQKQVQLQNLDMTYIPFDIQIGDKFTKPLHMQGKEDLV
jgi:hypothetical protein